MTAAPLFPLGAVDFRGQKLGIIQVYTSISRTRHPNPAFTYPTVSAKLPRHTRQSA